LLSELDVPTFATYDTRVTTREHAAAEDETVGEKCPGIFLNADFHFTFMDLLHVVKLRHETDGCTSPPKKGVLRIFSP
jgi:hypothetical protein